MAEFNAVSTCRIKHENGSVCVKDKGHEDYHATVREGVKDAVTGFFWWGAQRRSAQSAPEAKQ